MYTPGVEGQSGRGDRGVVGETDRSGVSGVAETPGEEPGQSPSADSCIKLDNARLSHRTTRGTEVPTWSALGHRLLLASVDPFSSRPKLRCLGKTLYLPSVYSEEESRSRTSLAEFVGLYVRTNTVN